MKWFKRIGYVLLALIIASLPAYWWLVAESQTPHAGRYTLDMAEVRRLADTIAGAKPQLIRLETVSNLSAPEALVVAGDSWRNLDMPVSSYELVFPDHVAIVDTAFNAAAAKSMGATAFDDAAYERLNRALANASPIVVTHEHPDHIGGLLAQPELKKLLGVSRLTKEQVTEVVKSFKTQPLAQLHLPPDLFSNYPALAYARYLALAPGVVLIKSPGHTPGSQMVYVRRADGMEFLFLGDVAWRMRNVETMREKARLVTWLASEDRSAVLDELAELNRLHATEPTLHMMPGHDAVQIKSFINAGLLTKGF